MKEVKVSKWEKTKLSKHIKESLEAMSQIEREFKNEECNPFIV